jgi:hypothetical protein
LNAPIVHDSGSGVVRQLETVYYDTPERVLFQRGMSLRVRRSGKHFIQTFKLLPDIGRPLARSTRGPSRSGRVRKLCPKSSSN